ncbi:hypothetical protein D3H65_23940 [Paraflavitalea soli]|uniref:Uncharacterized protein n=1 Tax=Paraflavitalea soli TaxID=2315862 RepID=A0A3B7MQN7_9BACT|nr:hypothetical protein [Paraflavitalea soli]AXY76854.1 hypothetical protein D3H65_23940 [Paraflavitalea soli]
MNTIHHPQEGDPRNPQELPEEIQENISHYHHEENSMEGSEFMDDAIRMHEQPLGEQPATENE